MKNTPFLSTSPKKRLRALLSLLLCLQIACGHEQETANSRPHIDKALIDQIATSSTGSVDTYSVSSIKKFMLAVYEDTRKVNELKEDDYSQGFSAIGLFFYGSSAITQPSPEKVTQLLDWLKKKGADVNERVKPLNNKPLINLAAEGASYTALQWLIAQKETTIGNRSVVCEAINQNENLTPTERTELITALSNRVQH